MCCCSPGAQPSWHVGQPSWRVCGVCAVDAIGDVPAFPLAPHVAKLVDACASGEAWCRHFNHIFAPIVSSGVAVAARLFLVWCVDDGGSCDRVRGGGACVTGVVGGVMASRPALHGLLFLDACASGETWCRHFNSSFAPIVSSVVAGVDALRVVWCAVMAPHLLTAVGAWVASGL